MRGRFKGGDAWGLRELYSLQAIVMRFSESSVTCDAIMEQVGYASCEAVTAAAAVAAMSS